jgi:RNA polymerase sigma-70 factor (ECF subfamily)
MSTTLTLRRVGIRRRTDDDVFSLALDGDPVAFSEVYRRYHRRVYGYCLARLMEPEAAADAAQEVFVRFLDTPRQGINDPRAWTFAIARNVTIDAIRKRARSPELGDGAAADHSAGVSTATAADEYLGREDTRNVFVALRRLRPRYRTALILREMHHESSADMAAALGMTPGAVDTLVCRARDAFGRTYAEVAELPTACSAAVTAIYKRKGSGLDAVEEARLESHLVACLGCQAEAKRAARLDGLSSLIPFLVPATKLGLNPFEKAALSLRDFPDVAARLGYVLTPDHVTPAMKVATGLLAITLVAVPVIGTIGPQRDAGPSRPAVGASSNDGSYGDTAPGSGHEADGPYASTEHQMYHEALAHGSWQQHDASHTWTATSQTGSHAVEVAEPEAQHSPTTDSSTHLPEPSRTSGTTVHSGSGGSPDGHTGTGDDSHSGTDDSKSGD